MTPAPSWLRRAMLATAVMNGGAALLFLPPAGALRALAGFPAEAPAIYLCTVALFVGLFGAGYAWVGLTGRVDPMFVALTAAGKFGFVALVTACTLAGQLAWRAPLIAAGDLVFAALFAAWLVGRR